MTLWTLPADGCPEPSGEGKEGWFRVLGLRGGEWHCGPYRLGDGLRKPLEEVACRTEQACNIVDCCNVRPHLAPDQEHLQSHTALPPDPACSHLLPDQELA